jgi:hypothetical protein
MYYVHYNSFALRAGCLIVVIPPLRYHAESIIIIIIIIIPPHYAQLGLVVILCPGALASARFFCHLFFVPCPFAFIAAGCFLPTRIHIGCAAHRVSCPLNIKDSFPGIKQPKREVRRSLLLAAKLNFFSSFSTFFFTSRYRLTYNFVL